MTDYYLRAEAGKFKIIAHPIGMTVEGDPEAPGGRSVISRPSSGGTAESHIDGQGRLRVTLSAPLDVGRTSEARVLKTLAQAVAADRGSRCSVSPGAEDARGEDGVLWIGGSTVQVQIVTLPSASSVWKELAESGATSLLLEMTDVVRLVRISLERKRDRVAPMILALDASHIGAAVGPQLVREYIGTYGEPNLEYGWTEVWLVGSTVRSTRRLSKTDG